MNMPMLKLHGRKFVHLDGLRALGLALILGGCGGGVDSGGTGAQPQSFASGPITGFGSVIVNGVRFDDSKATVVDDEGTARSRDDLRLGMTTEIRGTGITLATDGSGTNVSAASNIVYASELLGPLQSVDVAGKRLVVLGQTVDINTSAGTTVFDEVSVPGGLAALAAGDLVEVYAQFDAASGHYLATRVERKGSVATYRLRGVVSILNATTKTFNIGTQTISYAGLATAPPTSLANGNFMRVRLQTAQVGGLWLVAGLSEGVEKPKEMDAIQCQRGGAGRQPNHTGGRPGAGRGGRGRSDRRWRRARGQQGGDQDLGRRDGTGIPGARPDCLGGCCESEFRASRRDRGLCHRHHRLPRRDCGQSGGQCERRGQGCPLRRWHATGCHTHHIQVNGSGRDAVLSAVQVGARCTGSIHSTVSGLSIGAMSRFTATASPSLRTSTHSSTSVALALISWCGTKGGT
jgi:hypothetical protein